MPKIPWTPPDRPPRLPLQKEPEPLPAPPPFPCSTCLGEGVLYKDGAKGGANTKEIPCWTCGGTGMVVNNSDRTYVTQECSDMTCPDRSGGRHYHLGGSKITWLD